MDTAAVQSATTSKTTSATTPSSSLDKNAFLKLLVAQLQHQDPTTAQDPNQMVQQMATFSGLEAQQNTNAILAAIQTQNAALYQAQSADLIGKKIQINSGTVGLAGGTAAIGVNLAADGNATLVIKNAAGQVVRTLGPGALGAGDSTINWNGKDDDGNQLADGNYTASISAKSASGAAITASTSTSAVVTAVSFVSGQVMVTAGGNQYSLSNITKISG